jgi:hypothetical protein
MLSHAVRECKWRPYEKRVLRKIFGPERRREEVTEKSRKLGKKKKIYYADLFSDTLSIG